MATETTEHHQAAPQATASERCATCGAGLDVGQGYCLNCGTRQSPARSDLLAALAPPVVERETVAVTPARTGPLLRSREGGLALAGLLALGLLVGGLLFGGGEDERQPIVVNVPKQEAARVNVNVPAGGAAAATPADIASDWPGDDGWTVQVATVPAEGATQAAVDAAKAAATGKGAKDVGVIDPADYPSLDPESYVVYSGVYPSKKLAKKARRKLLDDFPDAEVVEVAASEGGGSGGGGAAPKVDKDAKKASDGELKELEGASGDDFVKKSKKLKDKVATSGKAPKKDNKPPGGGSGGGTVLE